MGVEWLVGLVVASVVWGLRLEGQLGKTNQRLDDYKIDKEKLDHTVADGLEKLIEAKFEAMDSRMERIERALNGSLYGRH